MAESSLMSNSNSPSKDCHSPNVSMLGEVEMVEQGGEEGAEGGSSGGVCRMQARSDPLPELLLLLLEVTQTDGRPLPVGMFTACMVAQHVIELTGQNPVEIDVMNDHNTLFKWNQKLPLFMQPKCCTMLDCGMARLLKSPAYCLQDRVW